MPDPTAKPLSLSIFSAQTDLLRKQWLLWDIFRANSIIGVCNYSTNLICIDKLGLIAFMMVSQNLTGVA